MGTPSSQRRAATRATRTRQADKGEAYNAARQATTDTPAAAVPPTTSRIRRSLPGPVPPARLSSHARGSNARAGDVATAGTPAGDIWQANGALYEYVSGWAERSGDSPADLAAAVDGLIQLAANLHDVALTMLGQVHKRVREGSLVGVDDEALQEATEDMADDEDHAPNVMHCLLDLRTALGGARPELPPARSWHQVPAGLAEQMAGKTVIELRAELGQEAHLQRDRSENPEPNYDKAYALERMIQWCHATGRDTYDPQAHASADASAAS